VIVLSTVGKDFATVKATLAHPLVAILMLLFVLSSVIHMRIGMQVVIEDYVHEEGPKVLLLMFNTFFAIAVGLASAFAILKLAFGA
jgi:succinate dehydrogenase / fumarate reductase membrane anchor subunit